MSPSSVLDDEDNMNRNISTKEQRPSNTVVNQHLSHISVFYPLYHDDFSYYRIG